MSYPENDTEFEDKTIKSVEFHEDGTYAITQDDGLSLWCGESAPIVPEAGMTARLYGKRFGRVRGLFINGVEFWYRTEEADHAHSEVEMYGADAADWLARWDAGKSVWSIEMGGLGPGYEQCIQIVAAEVLRWLLANKPDMDSEWAKYDGEMGKVVNEITKPLGLSGTQWGAGVHLAAHLYRQDPRGVMNDPQVQDRKIQIARTFPQLSAQQVE
jgi:hypothetical protein